MSFEDSWRMLLTHVVREALKEVLLPELTSLIVTMQQKPANGSLLTVDEVAAHCRATSSTVRTWIKAGSLKTVRVGHRYLVRPLDLDNFLFSSNDQQLGDSLDVNQHVVALLNKAKRKQAGE